MRKPKFLRKVKKHSLPLLKKIFSIKRKKGEAWGIGIFLYLFYLVLFLEEFSPWVNWAKKGIEFSGSSILAGIVIFLFISYFQRYKKEIFFSGSHLGLFLLVNILIAYLSWGIWKLSGTYYFFPLPLLGFLLTPFLGIGATFLSVILTSFILSFLGHYSWSMFTYCVVSGTVSTLAVSYTHRRMEILKAGLVAGLFSYFTILTLGFLNGDIEKLRGLITISFYGLGNGVIWSIVTFGMLPLLEHISGLVTDARLLELSDVNHPLLQRLRKEAPGTFQSCLMVGTLSEEAAEVVGANPLLARVGAYYHDIGKLKNPYYFTENQKTANIHDRINPTLSALVLISHVKEGVNLGKKYHLPKVILDIISQHHGTTLASFFYDKARKNLSHTKVREEDFRYPGPRPKTKEAAIVMLADSIEAASRTLESPSPSRIRNLVERIVTGKLEDHQLCNAPLSLKDIEALKESFVRTLQSIFHTRVEYPVKESKEK